MDDRRSSRRRSRTRRTRVNVLPLIDVMFLLLCFFILMTLSMVIQQGIFVDLARAESGDSIAENMKPVVISVSENGELFWNKQPVSRSRLRDRLEKRVQAQPEVRVHVNADRQTRHASVVSALDLIRKTGVRNVVFTVRPES